jgi:hypothetical protein
MSTAPRTVPVTVPVEDRLQHLLQQHRRRSLRHPVTRIRHPEQTHAFPMIFRYLHAPHRTREIAPRAHPVPQLVQIVLQLLLEQADADRVHARRPVIGPAPLPRPVNEALIYLERLHLRLGSLPRLLPLRAGLGLTLVCTAPSLQPYYRTFTTTTGRPAPVPRTGTLRSRCPPLAVLPLAARETLPGCRYRGDRFSCSMPAPATSSRHLYTGHRQGSMQAAPWLRARICAPLSRGFGDPPVLMPSFRLSMRQQWFTYVRLLVAHLTR